MLKMLADYAVCALWLCWLRLLGTPFMLPGFPALSDLIIWLDMLALNAG